LLPGLPAAQLREIIQDQLYLLDIQDYQLEDLIDVPAVETYQQAEIAQDLAAAVEKVICGYGVNYGGIHGPNEWVDLASLQSVTEVYVHTIVNFLNEK
jgi:acetylornithine deacetylase/succinyl-diaminopimelate desuccinylase-like protein